MVVAIEAKEIEPVVVQTGAADRYRAFAQVKGALAGHAQKRAVPDLAAQR